MGLFRTTHIHKHESGGGFPSKIEVIEKKAPTDESIKLLNEFEGKAKNNILEKIHLNNTIVDAVAIIYISGLPYDHKEFQLKFKINGKDFIVKERINGTEHYDITVMASDIIVKYLLGFIELQLRPLITEKMILNK